MKQFSNSSRRHTRLISTPFFGRTLKAFFLLFMLTTCATSALAQTEISSLSDITDMAGNYKLTADISASGNTSLGTFTGTLDGDFHTISGLSNAIFTSVNGGTVKNIILDNVSINITTNNADVGAIANTASGNARIYNCGVLSTNGTSSISGTRYVGSIVGALSNNARVLNCFSYANVGGGTRVAGIVGSNNGTTVTTANRNNFLSGTGSMVFNSMFFGRLLRAQTNIPFMVAQPSTTSAISTPTTTSSTTTVSPTPTTLPVPLV